MTSSANFSEIDGLSHSLFFFLFETFSHTHPHSHMFSFYLQSPLKKKVGAVEKYTPEFKKRNTKPIAVSADSAESHSKWVADINETQNVNVNYPILADPDRKIAKMYGMLDQTK